jgi:hypothetical protein
LLLEKKLDSVIRKNPSQHLMVFGASTQEAVQDPSLAAKVAIEKFDSKLARSGENFSTPL